MFAALLIALIATPAVIGLLLLWRGLWPRRTGDAPHCRRCGYNLTGLDLSAAGARCPECGTDVTRERAVAIGRRRTRRGLVACGVVALLLALVPAGIYAYGQYRKVDWYTYRPTALVLKDCYAGDVNLALRALSELDQRDLNGQLRDQQFRGLVAACLVHQPDALTYGQLGMLAAKILDVAYRSDRLTPAEANRFFANMVEVRLKARPRVVQGQRLPILWEAISDPTLAGSGGSYDAWWRLESLDEPKPSATGRLGPPEFQRWSGSSSRLGPYAPGRHQITGHVELVIVRATQDEHLDPDMPVLYRDTRTVKTEVEVLAEEPPDLFTLVHSEEIGRLLEERARLCEIRVQAPPLPADSPPTPDEQPDSDSLDLRLELSRGVPVTLALEAAIEWNHHRVKVGSFVIDASEGRQAFGYSTSPVPALPPDVTVVLRCSKRVALDTVDIYEFWSGELRFEHVAVVEGPQLQWGDKTAHWYSPTVIRCDSCDDTGPDTDTPEAEQPSRSRLLQALRRLFSPRPTDPPAP